jgi:hypothetical protein
MMRAAIDCLGVTYTTFYWCLYPPSTREEVVPNLQDCQDDLQDRLQRMRARLEELRVELRLLKTNRDKAKLRRKFLEFKSIEKDIAVTENTLFTIDRQIELFERSKLDGLIIDTLRKSSSALQELKGSIPELANVEDVTDTLANRMSEVNDITQTLSTALSKGLDDDFSTLEDELEEFLREDTDVESKVSEAALVVSPEKVPSKPSHLQKSDSMSDVLSGSRRAQNQTRVFGVESRKTNPSLRKTTAPQSDSDSDTEASEKQALLAQ